MKRKFSNCFDHDGKPIKGYKAEINLKGDAKPKFCAARPIPYGMKDKIEHRYDELERAKVVTPVRYSEWATPVVHEIKSNGDIRVCLDCKVTLNRYVETDHYKFPMFEDIIVELEGCDTFCKIDLAGAYQQLELGEKSRELLTANSHKGLLRFNRLVEGVSSAGSIFQAAMDGILLNVRKARRFIDDIILGGKEKRGAKRS